MPEEMLIKQTFTERLKTQQLERKLRLHEMESEKRLERKRDIRNDRKKRKGQFHMASLEYFLRKKLDYKGGIQGFTNLPAGDLDSVEKEALNNSVRKVCGSGLANLLVLGLGAYEALALNALPLALVTTVVLGTAPFIVFMHHLWFVTKGYYLRRYCMECFHQRGTVVGCYHGANRE